MMIMNCVLTKMKYLLNDYEVYYLRSCYFFTIGIKVNLLRGIVIWSDAA